MKYIYFFLISLFSLGQLSCTTSAEPGWLEDLIDQFKSEPVGNPPQSVWQYIYHGETVYYVPAQCCDQFSSLYDKNGNLICAPDGGISGGGNGACTDFFSKRKDEKLIWKDRRTRDTDRKSEGVIIWQGDYAADGCGFFVKINGENYKPENESIIGDEYKRDSTRVNLKFKYLNEIIEYSCGLLPDVRRLPGIKIISIKPK